MKQTPILRVGCAVLWTMLMISCASHGTMLTHSKVDEAYQGIPVSDILVIGILDKDRNRRNFEHKFVAQLASAGVEAVSSADVIPMPADLKLEKADILKAVRKLNNDAIIVTHLMGVGSKKVFTRNDSAASNYYDFYGSRYDSLELGHSSTTRSVRLETNLYDVITGKRIWTGHSKTWNRGSDHQITDDIIRVVIDELKRNKLISPR